jgi:hypothetical protein
LTGHPYVAAKIPREEGLVVCEPDAGVPSSLPKDDSMDIIDKLALAADEVCTRN